MAQEKKPKPAGYTFGRPTLYRPELCEKLIEHMAQGLSFESFGSNVEIDGEIHTFCSTTLYGWLNEHEDFLKAKRIGMQKSMEWHEKVFNAMALGKIKNGNATALLFMMKNRHRWKDNPDADEQKHNVTIVYTNNKKEDK